MGISFKSRITIKATRNRKLEMSNAPTATHK